MPKRVTGACCGGVFFCMDPENFGPRYSIGKLSFVLRSGVFGACGRAASQPFFCRAHPLDNPDDVLNKEISRSGHNFTHAMRKASRFYDALFANLQPRRYHLGAHPRGKVVVYTDAQFDPSRAGLGIHPWGALSSTPRSYVNRRTRMKPHAFNANTG